MRVIKITDGIVSEVKYLSNDYVLKENEIESEIGELRQMIQPDGSFIDPEPSQTTPETTLEDKINFIYYKQMGVL